VRPADPRVVGPDGFFYAVLAGPDRLRQEVFALGYHLHWGWAEVMGLDCAERVAFVRLLQEVLGEQQQALERARRGG
jgi:hypothetical protein